MLPFILVRKYLYLCVFCHPSFDLSWHFGSTISDPKEMVGGITYITHIILVVCYNDICFLILCVLYITNTFSYTIISLILSSSYEKATNSSPKLLNFVCVWKKDGNFYSFTLLRSWYFISHALQHLSTFPKKSESLRPSCDSESCTLCTFTLLTSH